MFVARPISVFISTLATSLNWREKLFISWVGPRGIVAASVASLFAFTLEGAGVEEGQRLLALTFLAIMLTVTIQGLTASSVSRILGVHTLERRKAIIVGASPLARAIAKAIQENGRPIALVDTNQTMVELAQQEGLEAFHGNALEEDLLEQTDIDDAETLLAVTANSEVNVLVAQMAHDNFGIRRSYPSIKNPERGANLKLLNRTGGKLAFGRLIDILPGNTRMAKSKESKRQCMPIGMTRWSRRLNFPRAYFPYFAFAEIIQKLFMPIKSGRSGTELSFLQMHH